MSTNETEVAKRVLPLIDLTLLGTNDTTAEVEALCDSAATPFGNVAAVCVWPEFVEAAVARLAGAGIDVAAVANFPEGDNDPGRAIADSKRILEQGGREVDVVFPWRSLRNGELGVGRDLVAATRAAIGPDIVLKVIVESGELAEPELIRTAAQEALAGGADFLKTSTGKTAHSATPEAARILLQAVAENDGPAGVKISGGVKTVSQAGEYLNLADEICGPNWVGPKTFRFGASSLLQDVLRALAD